MFQFQAVASGVVREFQLHALAFVGQIEAETILSLVLLQQVMHLPQELDVPLLVATADEGDVEVKRAIRLLFFLFGQLADDDVILN